MGNYIREYPICPDGFVVPIHISPRLAPDDFTKSSALIDTGSNSCFIEMQTAIDELGFLPRVTDGYIHQPSINQQHAQQQQLMSEQLYAVDLIVTIGSLKNGITRKIGATLCWDIISPPGTKKARMLLGMDFLNQLDMYYFNRPEYTMLTLFDPS